MKRRKFIYLSAAGFVSVSVPFVSCNSANSVLDKKLRIPDMLSHLTDAKNITEIGKAYGKKFNEEYSVNKLEKLLNKNANNHSFPKNASTQQINEVLVKQVQSDFDTGRIIRLKGWILSVTEARQCALFSLTQS